MYSIIIRNIMNSIDNLKRLLKNIPLLFFKSRSISSGEYSPRVRSIERYRRIAHSSLASIFAKGSTVLTSIITIPLTVNYLGIERFGLWMTLSSILVILSFVDLGLGTGLINAITRADGQDDRGAAHASISNTFFILFIQTALLITVLVAITPRINWQAVYNLKGSVAISEAGLASFLLVFIYLLGLPFTVVQKTHDGYQEGYINHIFQIFGSVLTVVMVVIVIHIQLGLPWLVIAFAGVPRFALLANFSLHFLYQRPWLRPTINIINFGIIKDLFRVGWVFFLLNLFTMIGFNADNIIISNILGASAVAEYAIVQKMAYIAILYWTFLQALWPAYGEALARRDYAWVKKTIYRSIWLSSIGGLVLGGFLYFFGQEIVELWIGSTIIPGKTLLLGFSIFIIINGFVGIIASVINSSTFVIRQLLPFTVATIVSLIIKIFIVTHYGASYVIWGTSIGYSIFYIIPCVFIIKRNVWNN